MKDSILLIGGGGHCKSCIDVIEQEGMFRIAGIVDAPEKQGSKVLGYEVLGSDDDLPGLVESCPNVLITLGHVKSPTRRMELFDHLKRLGARFPVIRSSLSYVSPHAQVGEGTIIMHYAVLNAGAEVGRNCIVNTKALIEHDVVVGDNSHVSTGAIVNGGVRIGAGTFIGSNSVFQEYASVPPGSFAKANSLIVRKASGKDTMDDDARK